MWTDYLLLVTFIVSLQWRIQDLTLGGAWTLSTGGSASALYQDLVPFKGARAQKNGLKSTYGGYCNAEVVGGRAGMRAGVRASTFGFRSITLVCLGLLTPNLLYA